MLIVSKPSKDLITFIFQITLLLNYSYINNCKDIIDTKNIIDIQRFITKFHLSHHRINTYISNYSNEYAFVQIALLMFTFMKNGFF